MASSIESCVSRGVEALERIVVGVSVGTEVIGGDVKGETSTVVDNRMASVIAASVAEIGVCVVVESSVLPTVSTSAPVVSEGDMLVSVLSTSFVAKSFSNLVVVSSICSPSLGIEVWLSVSSKMAPAFADTVILVKVESAVEVSVVGGLSLKLVVICFKDSVASITVGVILFSVVIDASASVMKAKLPAAVGVSVVVILTIEVVKGVAAIMVV